MPYFAVILNKASATSESQSNSLEPTAYLQQPKLLIVDDEDDIRTPDEVGSSPGLWRGPGRRPAKGHGDCGKGKTCVVTLDLGLPPRPADVEEGFATLSEMLSFDPFIKIIIITGRGEREHALKAVLQDLEKGGTCLDDVVLVTGGGGGIGSVICQKFAQAGARVIITDVNLEAARAVAAKLPGEGHFASDTPVDAARL
jgi:3-oxoacyl-ACP reductase-like protein